MEDIVLSVGYFLEVFCNVYGIGIIHVHPQVSLLDPEPI